MDGQWICTPNAYRVLQYFIASRVKWIRVDSLPEIISSSVQWMGYKYVVLIIKSQMKLDVPKIKAKRQDNCVVISTKKRVLKVSVVIYHFSSLFNWALFNEHMNEWTSERTNERMNEWMAWLNWWIYGWKNGWMDSLIDERMSKWMDGWINSYKWDCSMHIYRR